MKVPGAAIILTEPAGARLHVLVIDDSPADAALIAAALNRDRSSSFRVDRVTCVADGLEQLRGRAPDCVLLDLDLPDAVRLDGLSTLTRAAPEVPVIVVTGCDDTSIAFDAVANGAQDYLVKDRMDVELLGRAIRYAVSRKRAELEILERERDTRAALDALAQSEARYRTLVSVLEEGVILEDHNGTTLAANPSAERILGVASPSLASGGWVYVDDEETELGMDDLPWVVALRSSKEQTKQIIGVRRPDGTTVWLSLSSQPLCNVPGEAPYGVVTSFGDVSERVEMLRRLHEMAHHDALTGLPNRTVAISRIERALGRLDDAHSCLGVFYLDLDGFKAVNDTHGHEVGDKLLRAVGHRLVDVLRPEDTVARLGGDEFVAVCEHLRSPEDAAVLTGRITAALRAPFQLSTLEVKVGVSTGYALATTADTTAAQLLREADLAMFAVKRVGPR